MKKTKLTKGGGHGQHGGHGHGHQPKLEKHPKEISDKEAQNVSGGTQQDTISFTKDDLDKLLKDPGNIAGTLKRQREKTWGPM